MTQRDVYVCYTTIDQIARLGRAFEYNKIEGSVAKEVLSPIIAELLKPTEVFVIYRLRENLPLFTLTTFLDGRPDHHFEQHFSIFSLAVPYTQKELLAYLGRNVDIEGQPLNCHMILTTSDLAELVLREVLNVRRHAIEVK